MTDFLEEKQDVINLRRYKSSLEICGKGTLILAIWSIVRFFMQVTMDDNGIAYIQKAIEASGDDAEVLFWIIFAVFLGIILGIHIIIALNAIAEAKGKKKGYFYIILCLIIAIVSIYSLLDVFNGSTYFYSFFENVIMFLLSVLSIAVEFGVIVNSIRIKRINKKLAEEVM